MAAKEPQKITVTLPDGKEVEAQSWRTTPYDVAKGIRSVGIDGEDGKEGRDGTERMGWNGRMDVACVDI